MSNYIQGQQYFKNRDTGAVFPYRADLLTIGSLDLYDVDVNGNLYKAGSAPPDALNPTKTPEKKADHVEEVAKATPKTATMTPVEK